jgi:hypothetical protein
MKEDELSVSAGWLDLICGCRFERVIDEKLWCMRGASGEDYSRVLSASLWLNEEISSVLFLFSFRSFSLLVSSSVYEVVFFSFAFISIIIPSFHILPLLLPFYGSVVPEVEGPD